MKTKKLLITALCVLLAFAPVLPARAAESSGDSDNEETRVPEITQFDDADKTKFQALIYAMIEAVEADAFGKPAYTWTVPDLTDFVNKKFPNMTKTEEEHDIVWKDGSEASKDKTITYWGGNINTQGRIERIDIYLSDGSLFESQDLAEYYVNVTDDYLCTIQASDHVLSNGSIYNNVMFTDKQALTDLSSLNKALTMIDDPEVVSYMKTESKVDNSRRYNFPDGTKMTFTPNENVGFSEDTRSEHQNSIDATLSYSFRNHVIKLHYTDGTYSHINYDTSFTPTDMYRLYNPNSGEHFYTANRKEADGLVAVGWHDEGLGWKAPLMSDTPVYRLYNPNSGDHHYTPNEEEKDNLIVAGWNDEGVGWYSFERETSPLYRLYNPNEKTGTHHYTTDEGERDSLVKQGWVDEGIGWYGM